MTSHPVMPDLIRHPYTTEPRHGHNHGYRLGGRYDERGAADTGSEADMTREAVDTCAGRMTQPTMSEILQLCPLGAWWFSYVTLG